MKRIIAASLAVACLCQTALAADVAVARVTYPSWTGFYVGVNTSLGRFTFREIHAMSREVTFTPIGHVRGGRKQATKDGWGNNRSRIELDGVRFKPDALLGIEELSHIEVIFYFHVHADEPTETGARHPRDRLDWPKVGIFAQRGRMRPNRIGLSTCRVAKVEGISIEVEGLDAVDGTPVLDIKPVWKGNEPRGEIREPRWAQEIMSKYW